MTVLRASWRALLLTGHLLTGAALTLIFNRQRKPGHRGRRSPRIVSWWHRRLCRILGVEIEVTGSAPLGNGMMVANHVSWLDIPVLGALCPTVFLSKAEVRRWPVIGWLAGSAGTLFITRGGGQSRTVASNISRALCAGGLLTLFPEGTTTNGTSVLRFHPRLMAPALETSTRVQPVALRYVCDEGLDPVAPFIGTETFGRHLWRVLSRQRFRVQVRFFEPLEPPYAGRRELADAARRRIFDALDSLPERRSETQGGGVPALGATHG